MIKKPNKPAPIKFQTSTDAKNRAKFYLLSCPSHAKFPTTLVMRSEATPIPLGSQATANQRTIYQYIHQNGAKSCQLVMGFTDLADGSVWNTMPPHTHTRRTEVYFYFDIPGDNREVAEAEVKTMCEKLLANTVIESYRVELA